MDIGGVFLLSKVGDSADFDSSLSLSWGRRFRRELHMLMEAFFAATEFGDFRDRSDENVVSF